MNRRYTERNSFRLNFGFFALVMILSFTGCRKYDEGGKYSLTRSHLKTTWNLKRLTYNGYDVTNYLLISNVNQTFDRNKAYTLSYTNSQGQEIVQNGSWDYEKASFGSFDIFGSTSGTQPNVYIFIPNLLDTPLELVPGAFLKYKDNSLIIWKLTKKEFHYEVGSWEFWFEN